MINKMFEFIAIFMTLVVVALSNDRKHFGTMKEIINEVLTEKGLDNAAALLHQQAQEIERLNQALSQQGQEIQRMNQAVTHLQEENTNYERKIEVLKTELNDMNKTLKEKEKETKRIGNELAEMKKQIGQFKTAESVMDKETTKTKCSDKVPLTRKDNKDSDLKFTSWFEVKNKHDKNKIKKWPSGGLRNDKYNRTRSDVKEKFSKGKAVPCSKTVGTGIAFSAYVGKIMPHLIAGHVIKCDQVIFNDGNNYNPLTGIFTVSEPGVYLLTFTIATDHLAHWIWVKLVVDNREIVKAATDPQYDNHLEMGTNNAILRLNQGESVWLEVAKSNDSLLWAVTHSTTFSGVLLYA